MEDLYQKLKAYADEEDSGDTDYLMALLDGAVEEVMHERHPWDFASEEEREKIKSWALLNHRNTILQIAKYYYDKKGIYGVTSYYGNGENRYFENAGTPPSYLRNVIPLSRVI